MDTDRLTGSTLPLDKSIGHLLTIVTNLIHREMGQRLAKYGIPQGCWWYLRLLWEHDSGSQREMSERVGYTEATAGTAIRNLEKLGLVKRVRDGNDTRKIKVTLTSRGQNLRAKLMPLAIDIHNKALEGFSPAEKADLFLKMARVIENVRRPDASARGRQTRREPTSVSTSGRPRPVEGR